MPVAFFFLLFFEKIFQFQGGRGPNFGFIFLLNHTENSTLVVGRISILNQYDRGGPKIEDMHRVSNIICIFSDFGRRVESFF
jgi:hypothetical protein